MSRRRVVVTGMGIVSAAGHDLASFWRRLLHGPSCTGPIRRFDASGFPTTIAAEIDGGSWDAREVGAEWHGLGRIAPWAALASARAMADAGLGPGVDRGGVAFATGMGTYGHREVFAACAAARTHGEGFDGAAFNQTFLRSMEPRALERRTPGTVAALLAREHGLRGPVISPMTACAGGTQAIGDALRWIRLGRADVVLAGAADSELYPMGLASFCLLGALSTRNDDPATASRPFDAHRDGFVLGEGAAALVLEEREHALARGATIRAEVAGFGSADDAWRATDPHPEGRGAVLAMRRALADAGVGTDEIDYVNAHGTSTVANDVVETRAIETVFGAHAARLAVSSTKSVLGHLTVAAGAIEAVATVAALEQQILPPTLNLTTPDPACGLDYVPRTARAARIDAALSNSFAFGGQTAAVLFRRPTAR